MKTTVVGIVLSHDNSALRCAVAWAKLACGHVGEVRLREARFRCLGCGTEREDSFANNKGCPSRCPTLSVITSLPNAHLEADRLTKVGDEAECARCDQYAEALAKLRAFRPGDVAHSRFRKWCGVGLLYVYRRDTASPSGVELLMTIEETDEAVELLRGLGASPLSPTEGLSGSR